MTPITWRRVRAGEYESEAGRIIRSFGRWDAYRYVSVHRSSVGSYVGDFPKLASAKAACEEAWRRAQEGDTS